MNKGDASVSPTLACVFIVAFFTLLLAGCLPS